MIFRDNNYKKIFVISIGSNNFTATTNKCGFLLMFIKEMLNFTYKLEKIFTFSHPSLKTSNSIHVAYVILDTN